MIVTQVMIQNRGVRAQGPKPVDPESGFSGTGPEVIPVNYLDLINNRDPADPESGLSGPRAYVIPLN